MRHHRVLWIAALVALPPLGFAQNQPPNTATDLDTIVVTGTRTNTRTVAESTSPIDVLRPEQLQATGTTELATALARALPSLNFPRPAITDGTDAVRPAQLRGLAPDQVLVLVNGKRRHTTALVNLNGSQGRGSSPVDINAIPISAVSRIEVLRDGASAQYGSDAIAGVINIVLKGGGDGGSVLASAGQYSAGDGRQWNVGGDAGFHLGQSGFVRLAAQGGHQDQTDRARPFNGVVEQRYGDPEIDARGLAYNAEYSPAEGVTFYSFATANQREALSNGYFRAANDNRNRPQIYPNGFLPQIYNQSDDRSLVAGIKGTTFNNWDVDLSYNWGSNHLTFDVRNSLNNSLGLASPTQFYAGALEVTQNLLNLDIRRDFDTGWSAPLTVAFGAEWRGEKFNQSPGDTASWINGGVPSANGSMLPGAQVFAGFRPGDAGHFNRESYGVYADLETEFTDKFSAGIAARAEKYSDFGRTTSGKLSARYAFTPGFALRGTLSTGFRAPSLQQQFFQSTATNFIVVNGVNQPFDIRTFRVNDPAAVALGAEPLHAEKSRNASLGLVLQPLESLYMTIDAYRIDVDDRIVLSENLISTPVRLWLETHGYPGLGGGRYFTNAIDTRTTGVDLVGTYRWQLNSGTLELTSGFNYNKTEIRRIAPNPASLMAINPAEVRIGRTEIGRITKGFPRDKFFLGGRWDLGDFDFSATATRWGKFITYGATAASDQTYNAKWTLDVAANYVLGNWIFTLGGDNVLDEYPDESVAGLGTRNYLPYSTQSPFGFNGAYVYGKIGYKW